MSLFSISVWTPAPTRKPCLVKSAISADCFLTSFSRSDMRSHKMLTMDRISTSVPDLTLSSGAWQHPPLPQRPSVKVPALTTVGRDVGSTVVPFFFFFFFLRDLQVVVFDVLAPCSSHNFLPKGHTGWLMSYLTVPPSWPEIQMKMRINNIYKETNKERKRRSKCKQKYWWKWNILK